MSGTHEPTHGPATTIEPDAGNAVQESGSQETAAPASDEREPVTLKDLLEMTPEEMHDAVSEMLMELKECDYPAICGGLDADGYAWFWFYDIGGLIAFVNRVAVFDAGNNSLYRRIVRLEDEEEEETHEPSDADWSFGLQLHDNGYVDDERPRCCWEHAHTGKVDCEVAQVYVKYPASDLHHVFCQLLKHVAKEREGGNES